MKFETSRANPNGVESVDGGNIRKEIRRGRNLWLQYLPRSKAEEKAKEILTRTERMEKQDEVLAILMLLCLLNVVRGGPQEGRRQSADWQHDIPSPRRRFSAEHSGGFCR